MRHGLLEFAKLCLIDRGQGEKDDEEHQEQGDHVRVREEPTLPALLFVVAALGVPV